MDDNTRIGQRIKFAREKMGYTQDELGRRLGLNKSSIQRYETGKIQKIKLPILENIGFILDVNPSWLALKTDDPNYYGENTEAPGSLIDDSQPINQPTKEDLKFALFNGSEGITDEMYDEVKAFAELVKLREEQKKGKK